MSSLARGTAADVSLNLLHVALTAMDEGYRRLHPYRKTTLTGLVCDVLDDVIGDVYDDTNGRLLSLTQLSTAINFLRYLGQSPICLLLVKVLEEAHRIRACSSAAEIESTRYITQDLATMMSKNLATESVFS